MESECRTVKAKSTCTCSPSDLLHLIGNTGPRCSPCTPTLGAVRSVRDARAFNEALGVFPVRLPQVHGAGMSFFTAQVLRVRNVRVPMEMGIGSVPNGKTKPLQKQPKGPKKNRNIKHDNIKNDPTKEFQLTISTHSMGLQYLPAKGAAKSVKVAIPYEVSGMAWCPIIG